MKPRFLGVITPFITPFNEKLELDLDAARWLARYQAKNGVHGIFPNSTTGEFVHLSSEEAQKLVEVILEEVGSRVWVIPGISANATHHCIALGKKFKDMGVHGVVVTPPFFFKLSIEGLYKHFSMVAQNLDIPIIVYNIPPLTGVNIPIELYVKLAEEYSNIVAAKVTFESFPYIRKLILEVKSIRKDFAVLTGLDEMLLPVLMMGGDGGIMALANAVPQLHRAIYDSYLAGDLTKAVEEYRKLLKLVKIYDITTSFPSGIKALLSVLGAPVKPFVRPPLLPESSETIKEIAKIVDELGLKLSLMP